MTQTLPIRSELWRLTASDTFWWSTGIEDTFITAPHPVTGRTLDEYELTGHYDRWRDDLDLIAELDVPCARYGVPWHRIQPAPNKWDWTFPDKALGHLLDLGITPQVDLVHYGLPGWIEDAFLHPDYPMLVSEYAARFADRFHGRIRWYTPLNEPRITAWYCGRLGWWPPYRRSWSGFVTLMLAIAKGMVETVKALESVDPEIVPYFVDATDLYDTDEPALEPEAKHRQRIVFLALDLVSGRVSEQHELWPWLLKHGAKEADLIYFLDNAIPLPVIGMNLYPMFTQKMLMRDAGGRFRIRMPYAKADLISRLGHIYYNRYGVPLMISETASMGSLRRRFEWLSQSVAATKQLRNEGVPLVGYTWWPMFSLVTWAYRQGRRSVAEHLAPMGLWDIVPTPTDPLGRVRTSLVDAYQHLVQGGIEAVGTLSRTSVESARAR